MSEVIKVHFDPKVVSLIMDYSRQRNEAGGLLLGHRYIKEGSVEYEIIKITTPSFMDIRARALFQRRDKSHLEQAVQFHRDTNGYGDYLGEWHTHPGGASIKPSIKDLLAFRSSQKLTKTPLIYVIANSYKLNTYTSGGNDVVSYY
ncbi:MULTISPECIES: Mov34/MPN/PAD-1 family protein [Pseudoalteromonas]|uniref:JAB domain-containing protein n=1 Tax=Pseudoalteromonas undina TaxID=43660 RepID=A0ABN0NDA8_9GAMM|nr:MULTISPECIES: Mov34/MPN/PAD-1 family protein [Pseudoalteromonas]MBH0030797.1 Mov34/MPN/PAD-1 family protein [Pseudoalteromonas sp. SWYJZ98]PKG63723.1 hypothetical protein CXF75_14075 [Pseudoalteromonas arctica]PKG70052.1 hypothetical protein CXF64_12895 [Pseudoalteromonas sp. GutCa3]